MVTERGVIEDLSGRKAMVRIKQNSACATCQSRDSCEVASGRSMVVEVDNGLGGGKGDHVELSVPAGTLVKISLLVYILPVIAMIGGAFLGGAVAGAFNLPVSAGSVVGGFSFMGVVFYLLKRFDRSLRARGEFGPRITRILPE